MKKSIKQAILDLRKEGRIVSVVMVAKQMGLSWVKMSDKQKHSLRNESSDILKRINIKDRIKSEKTAKKVKSISVHISLVKSKAWGLNPHAIADVTFKDGSFISLSATCSGCGYDKESDVFARLLNQVLKYKIWSLKKSVIDSVYGITKLNGNCVFFGGGIGMSCYTKKGGIIDAIGGKVVSHSSTKNFDSYYITFR